MLATVRSGGLKSWIAGISVLLMIMGGCTLGRDRNAPMRLEMIEGTAQLSRDGKVSTVRRTSSVEVGDVIKVGSNGLAELRLAPGRGFELAGAQVEITGRSTLSLLRGDVLADVSSPAVIKTDGLEVSANRSAFRLDKALSTRVGVYESQQGVNARSTGASVRVPRLRQTIVAGGIVDVAKPLRLSSADRWDRRYLQQVIELDERLINFGRGLEAQLGVLQSTAFFQQVSPPDTDLSFLGAYVPNRRSDLLIGLSIAMESKKLQGLLPERFASVFGLWENQATWGLIAYEFGAPSEGIFSRLLDAINKAGLQVIGGTGPGLRRPSTAGQPPSGNQPGGGSSPAPSPTPTRTTRPRPPAPSPVSSLLPDPVEDPVNDVICGLIGAVCSS